jgi:FkbH-like protein
MHLDLTRRWLLSKTSAYVPHPKARRLARALHTNRHALAARLAENVRSWEKYESEFQKHAANPGAFVKLEFYVFIDYLDRYFSTGDDTYKILYISEKLNQLQFRKLTPEQDFANRLRVTEEDINALSKHLRGQIGRDDLSLLESTLREIQKVVIPQGHKELSVLLIGDCFYFDVRGFLAPLVWEDGITIRPTFIGTKNPAERRNQLRRWANERFDLIFYSPFTYESSPELTALHDWRKSLAGRDRIGQAISAALADFEANIDLLQTLYDVPTYVHNTANICRHDSKIRELAKTALSRRTRQIARRAANHRIAEVIAARRAANANIILFDEIELLEHDGEYSLGRKLYSTPGQHPAEFGRSVAQQYRDIIAAHVGLYGKKVLVTDLDNTLWKGEISEGAIEHFTEGQRTLKELRRKGILLAVNSKNDPKNVHWDGAVLNQDDFVHMEINWDSKAANMGRIQESLNLKLKDFVFIDDRADQRMLVKDAIPEIHVLDATSDRVWKQLARWAAALPEHPEIDRTEQYRQREQRERFIATTVEEDPATAFAKLDIRVEIREAKATELKRVAELINRTNQFNLAGSRTSLKELRDWHGDRARRIVVVEASDKFGSMGLICTSLLDLSGPALMVPTFVLSCRAFGYGIENAVINAIKSMARNETNGEVRPIRGAYRETPHNEPCRQMYLTNGFNWDGESWVLHQIEPLDNPPWLNITNQLSQSGTPQATGSGSL